MKAAGYIRVSTDGQATTGASCDMQRERIEAYCAARGLELVAIHRDNGVSAGKPLSTREAGAALLASIAAGGIDHVVSLKLDRLFRDAIDCLETVKAWDKGGVALHLVDMGGDSLNTASPTGRAFLTMAAAFAELERGLIAERTRQVKRHRKETGKTYCTAPLGYTNGEGSLVEDPGEIATVNRIFDLRGQGETFRGIADLLNDEGVETKRGGRWHASTVRYITQNTLYREAV